MKLEEIQSLIDSINQSNIEKFMFKNNDVTLEIVNGREISQTNNKISNNTQVEAEKNIGTSQKKIKNNHFIKSPLVGVFYEASGPDKNPFVVEGQRVKKGDVLCIVEAMKVMNEIVAKQDCIIKEILVSNEDIVEYDQKIFVIE